jgi:hypothetical protein
MTFGIYRIQGESLTDEQCYIVHPLFCTLQFIVFLAASLMLCYNQARLESGGLVNGAVVDPGGTGGNKSRQL